MNAFASEQCSWPAHPCMARQLHACASTPQPRGATPAALCSSQLAVANPLNPLPPCNCRPAREAVRGRGYRHHVPVPPRRAQRHRRHPQGKLSGNGCAAAEPCCCELSSQLPGSAIALHSVLVSSAWDARWQEGGAGGTHRCMSSATLPLLAIGRCGALHQPLVRPQLLHAAAAGHPHRWAAAFSSPAPVPLLCSAMHTTSRARMSPGRLAAAPFLCSSHAGMRLADNAASLARPAPPAPLRAHRCRPPLHRHLCGAGDCGGRGADLQLLGALFLASPVGFGCLHSSRGVLELTCCRGQGARLPLVGKLQPRAVMGSPSLCVSPFHTPRNRWRRSPMLC